jgi:hypothetical protein
MTIPYIPFVPSNSDETTPSNSVLLENGVGVILEVGLMEALRTFFLLFGKM